MQTCIAGYFIRVDDDFAVAYFFTSKEKLNVDVFLT